MSTPRHEYLSKRLGAYPSEFFSCPDSRLKGGGLHSVAVQLQWLWPPSPFAHGARQSPGKWRTPPGSASVSSTAHALPSCWTGSSPAAAALPHSAPALRACCLFASLPHWLTWSTLHPHRHFLFVRTLSRE